jgi:hypothetical protein
MTTRSHTLTVSLALLLTTSLCHAAWDKNDDALAYQLDGKDVWRLNYSQTKDTKPHFSILGPVAGPNLVCIKPKDHVWHYGLWFSWKFINGKNYWEEKNGQAEGKTAWDKPTVQTNDDGSATVAFAIRYGDLLNEARTLVISKPDTEGCYTIDWSATFTAVSDVKLDRYLPWGGYAGMSARLSQAFTNVQALTAQGPAELTGGKAHVDSKAAEMNGTIDGQDYGIAMLAEGTWYLICNQKAPNFIYFNDAVLYKNPKELKSGESFSLRYRIYVHKGRWSADKLKTLPQF